MQQVEKMKVKENINVHSKLFNMWGVECRIVMVDQLGRCMSELTPMPISCFMMGFKDRIMVRDMSERSH